MLGGDPGLAEVAADAARELGELRFHPALRRRGDEVRAEVAVRAAAAAARVSGAVVREEDLRALGARTVPGGGDPGLALAAGALRAAVSVDQRAGEGLRSPLQVLARLHALAASGQVPDAELGRPRPGTAPLAQAVAVVLGGPGPAVAAGAVVHAELVLADVLAPVSVPAAFAACRAVARARGLDPLGLGLPEVAADVDPAGYREALAAYPDDPPAWGAWWGRALVEGAAQGRRACEAVLAGRA